MLAIVIICSCSHTPKFFSFYSSTLLSRIIGGTVNDLVDDNDETRDRAKTILFASQRKSASCRSWTHAQMMVGWSSSYNYILNLCKGITSLLSVRALILLTWITCSHDNISGVSQKAVVDVYKVLVDSRPFRYEQKSLPILRPR